MSAAAPVRRRPTATVGDMQSKRFGCVRILRSGYGSNHALAIVLQLADGEPLATLSVNMDHGQTGLQSHELPEGCFYAKEWNENELVAADCLASGWFELVPELPRIASGYVEARVWRLREERGAPVTEVAS